MKGLKKILTAAIAVLVPFLFCAVALANDPCEVPDNGSGTVDLPADCPYTAPYEPMYIIDGLPPNTTMELEPTFDGFSCVNQPDAYCSMALSAGVCEGAGGSLGGNGHCFEASLELNVTGTGSLGGFNRTLWVPMHAEAHTAPRTPGDPAQTFSTDMYRLQGELFGDPDFCTFRVRGGTDYGLPGPGQTSLTELPSGDFAVDSFFDITYQIEFEGCPGSQLEDYAGTTTATVRWQQGVPSTTGACCRQDGTCVETPEAYCQGISGTYHGDDSACLGDGDGDGYDDLCFEPGTCLAPDNGSGTVDLPADCPYTAPYEPMEIIDGLPPGTTIELDPTLDDFFCNSGTPCSLSMPPSVCEGSGGSLGGNYHCFEATLDLDVSGTGDLTGFSRHLAVPVSLEVHTGPRNPGDPVQAFSTDMYRLQGELFGDPDFCTFRVTGGTDYGLPSPGHTTLTELPSGDFAVDSFFDITYQIEFEGCPGSPLDDYMGTTTATVRWQQGAPSTTGACCRQDGTCVEAPEAYCQGISGTYHGDDTACLGDGDGDGYDDLCFEPGTCLAPDNGSGTVDLPADCPYSAPDDPMMIINGLPPDTTIELDPILDDYLNIVRISGGSLGGQIQQFDATLDLTVSGTGDLAGFSRHLAVPVSLEVHTGSRTPGDPVQAFPAVVFRLQGELFGDPDFCTFRVRGGTDNDLPGPGFITLTELPSGDFAVDSFFDITYQIEFEGCPDSQLADYAGTTTATVRLKQGSGEVPATGACCRPGGTCLETTAIHCQGIGGTYFGDDTACLGDGDGDDNDDVCVSAGCCLTLDNGSGTVDLPADCSYTAPYEPMYIIDGLPPGTTIELDPIFYSLTCANQPDAYCSMALPAGVCEGPGGSLGGSGHCFEAALELEVSGTGDLTGFSRHLAVPINAEIHTGPRTPGDPIQAFSANMYRLRGELFGDPDFCTFGVTGGMDYGLPSPGQTILTKRPEGDFAIDSFFDITYQIEFEGCPGSPLADYAGTTMATVRWQQGLRDDGDCDGTLFDNDNCPFHYNPGQEDNYPPETNGCGDVCECEGDVHPIGAADGDVDGSDAFEFKQQFGRSNCAASPPCYRDHECDGDVDGSDAFKFKTDFGRSDCPDCTFSCPYE